MWRCPDPGQNSSRIEPPSLSRELEDWGGRQDGWSKAGGGWAPRSENEEDAGGEEEGNREGASSRAIREEAIQRRALRSHRRPRPVPVGVSSAALTEPRRLDLLRALIRVTDPLPRLMQLCIFCFSSQTTGSSLFHFTRCLAQCLASTSGLLVADREIETGQSVPERAP